MVDGYLDTWLSRRPNETFPNVQTAWYSEFADGHIAVFEFTDGLLQFDVVADGTRLRNAVWPDGITIEGTEMWVSADDETYIIDPQSQRVTNIR